MENEIKWGVEGNLSSISAYEHGTCIDFVFNNTETDSSNYEPLEFMGNVAVVFFEGREIPDMFVVNPTVGWEVITDNSILVAEGAQALITVCQILLG